MEQNKTEALLMYRKGQTAEEVAEALTLPLMIINKWFEEAGPDDQIQLEANMTAITTLTNQVQTGAIEAQPVLLREALQSKIESIGLDLANKLMLNIATEDFEYSKFLLCSSKTLKELRDLLPKDVEVEHVNPNAEHIEMFQNAMRP